MNTFRLFLVIYQNNYPLEVHSIWDTFQGARAQHHKLRELHRETHGEDGQWQIAEVQCSPHKFEIIDCNVKYGTEGNRL